MRTTILALRPLGAALTIAAVACGGPPQEATGGAALTSASPGSLAISMTNDPLGTVGTPMPFSIAVTNTTALAASGTVVGIFFPIGVQFGGGLPVECVKLSNLIRCAPGALASGATYALSIRVTFKDPGSFNVGTFVSATLTDGTFPSNSVQTVVTIIPGPTDVQVTGFASTGSPPVNSTFTYTFQVKNNGPQIAGGVTFSDTLPAPLAFAGVTTTSGSCAFSSGTVACQLGDLAVGAQDNVVITAVAPPTPQIIGDTATVASIYGDLKPDNNSVTVTVQIK